jgi:Spore Coat Protein U domain
MKKLSLALAALALCGAANAAGTANANFNVTVNFTPSCQAITPATGSVDFGAYTAFGPAVSAPTTAAVTFECSRGLSILGATINGGVHGVFPLSDLNYTLSLPTFPIAASGGSPATAVLNGIGTAATGSITVGGNLPSQPGGAGSGSETVIRQLVISF